MFYFTYFVKKLFREHDSKYVLRRESHQRRRKSCQALRSKLRWPLAICAFLLISVVVSAWLCLYQKPRASDITANSTQFHQPRTLKELLTLSPTNLEDCDIGLMNLLCAEGLPGAEDLDIPDGLSKLDSMADYVKSETQRHAYRFREHPEEFKNSDAYFRMNMLGTILVQDLGIRYNPAIAFPRLDGKIPTMADAANSQDMFIHGLLADKHLGTRVNSNAPGRGPALRHH